MKRREAIIGSTLLAGLSAKNVFAAGEKRFGDTIIPPAQELGKEKHVPIISAPLKAKAGMPVTVTVEVGKTVKHPNTLEHHIKWIQLYAREEDSKYVVELGTCTFGPTVADPKMTLNVMLNNNSTLYAVAHCNIHGVWDNSVDITVE